MRHSSYVIIKEINKETFSTRAEEGQEFTWASETIIFTRALCLSSVPL